MLKWIQVIFGLLLLLIFAVGSLGVVYILLGNSREALIWLGGGGIFYFALFVLIVMGVFDRGPLGRFSVPPLLQIVTWVLGLLFISYSIYSSFGN